MRRSKTEAWSTVVTTLDELYILVDVLAFIESIEDDNPARTLAWIFSKFERSRSYRRECEVEEWDAEIQLTELEVRDHPTRIRQVL